MQGYRLQSVWNVQVHKLCLFDTILPEFPKKQKLIFRLEVVQKVLYNVQDPPLIRTTVFVRFLCAFLFYFTLTISSSM